MVPDHDGVGILTRRHVALIVCSKVDLVLVARVNLSAINVHMQVKVSIATNARPVCAGANVIINDVPELIKLLNAQRVTETGVIVIPDTSHVQSIVSFLRVNESVNRVDHNKDALYRSTRLTYLPLTILRCRIRVVLRSVSALLLALR